MPSPDARDSRPELEAVIAAAALDGSHADYLRSRWLSQTEWLDRRASRAHRAYVTLRLVTIVGGVLLPAAVNVGGGNPGAQAAPAVPLGHWGVLVLGLAVAIAASIEGFFRFGERWRHYRRVAERLKAEGWLFAECTGPYASSENPSAAFPQFVARVEEILKGDVETFITTVASEKGAGAAAAEPH